MPVEFRLLGSLELVVDGEPRTLASPGEKAVLALLLLAAGRVVPREVLVDALWGEDLPANPANAVQGRMSRLRHALSDMGLPATLVAAQGPGYVASVEPDQVDAHRFAALIQQARAVGGNAQAASRLYAEALSLWRGPALADFAGEPWADGEAVRLQELRLAATEERIDLELDSGRHTDLIDQLEMLATENPLRERLHAQLMLALYRSGRQADALAAYRRLQRVLDDELGLDPSEDLRDLEQAILRQDPRLRAPARELPNTLTNLPVRVTSFVGRERELGQLSALLAEHRLVTLTGPGGAGKTSLAVQVAADTAGRWTDGAWLVRLSGVERPDMVAEAVAESVGAQRPAGAVTDSLVGYLRNRSALVVLDNCEHLVQACAELAERLLTSSDRLRLLVTSREPLRVPGEVQVALSPLAVPPPNVSADALHTYGAVELFVDRAARVNPGMRVDADAAVHIGRICRQLDGLPLALELAAARAGTLSIEELAVRIDDRFRLLTGGSRTAEARQKTLRATVDWSHQLLTEPERVLFRRLSVFRGGWTLQAAEAIASDATVPGEDVLDLVGALIDRSLIAADTGDANGRFRMLETLRQYALERADDAGESGWLAAAHARYFTALAETGQRALRGPQQTRWLQTLRQERSNVDAALQWSHDHVDVDPSLGLRLVAAMGWFWYFTSNQHAVGHIEGMLLRAAHSPPVQRALAVQAKSIVARPGSCIVHPSVVCAEAAAQSLQELSRLGEHHAAAYSRTLLAVEAMAGEIRPDPDDLLAVARQAFDEADDRWGKALTLFVEMELQFASGRLEQGTRTAELALALFRELDDHWGVSAIQYHHGMALHRTGQLAEALHVYRSALSEGRIGLTNTVQYALANLGQISLLLGDLDAASGYFTSAHAVARDLGADVSVLALLGQGDLGRYRHDPEQAYDCYTAAVARLAEGETPDWTAVALNGLGRLAQQRGDLKTAYRLLTRAWALVARDGRPIYPVAATTLEGLASVAAGRGHRRAAHRLLATAACWRQERDWPASPLDLRDVEGAATAARAESL
jgi:predicted ATPase/DNA-binding winged helix-turn-helix (wHTH) protein